MKTFAFNGLRSVHLEILQRFRVQLANRYGMAAGILGLAMVLLGIDSGLALLLPILASAFVLDYPHGAIDHLVVLGLAKTFPYSSPSLCLPRLFGFGDPRC